MKHPVIIALDFPSKKETFAFLDEFGSEKLFVKVGMELFYQEGAALLEELKNRDYQIFLDLKLHDIPNTVFRAMKGLAQYNIDLLTVHAAGGKEMMEAALEGLEAGTEIGIDRPKCVAVTQLTSTTEKQMQKEQLIMATIEQSVFHYATLAEQAGLDGVISSVQEAKLLREKFGESFSIITPGIRLLGDTTSDQKRVADPKTARKFGASGIVVGRSITKKVHPYEAYLKIKQEWETE